MRALSLFLLLLSPLWCQASWTVKSEFRLNLNEGIFDDLISDFWKTLQSNQNINIGSFTITPGGIPIQIRGVKAQLNYQFKEPVRLAGSAREWEISSADLSAKLTVDNISATQTIVREVDGVLIKINLQAECNNVVLSLPPGNTSLLAHVRAELENNQVKLSLPSYSANWNPGSWRVESMSCTGLDGFENIVKEEALKALASFQNFDGQVKGTIENTFANWSKNASLLLLSERELPSGKDYLKIFYQPKEAVETTHGIELEGEMRFVYPFVSPGQDIVNSYTLINPRSTTASSPQLLIPFATTRSLLMGEYFAGKLEYSLRSSEIPGFSSFMSSSWQLFWAWPELLRYSARTAFIFQFVPLGPPAFNNEKAAGTSTIAGQVVLPLSVRMYAPIKGKYVPMVEFRSTLAGPTTLKLNEGGQILMQTQAQPTPVTYEWAKKYLATQDPDTRIAVDTITDQLRPALNQQGVSLNIPSLKVGNSLELAPQSWVLEGPNMRVNFSAKK